MSASGSGASGTSARDAGRFVPLPARDTEGSIGRRFARVAARWPERAALETEGGRLSYAELDAESDRVARCVLAVCGPGPARVALICERPAALVPSLLGVLKAGAVYVPVDPAFPAARVAYLLKDSEAGLVLCDDRTHELARDLVAGDRPLANVEARGALSAAVAAPGAVEADALASLFYTSGSTGEPKGVLQTHRNLLQYARNYIQTLRMRPADRVSLLFSYSFSASIPDIFGSLLCGATLCPFDVKRRGPAALARWLREREITLLHLVPTLFRHLVRHIGEADAFPALRGVDLAGEAVYAADVAAFRRHFASECVLVNRLAATEASLVTRNIIGPDTPVPDGALPAGLPVDGMEVRIEDPEGAVLGPGAVGEIVLRSRFLSPGYWRKPELTAEAFRRDPERADLRLYRTGDRGRLRADGTLEHLGRGDQRVKIRGFTVELAEVERALRAVEEVRDCAVVVADERGRGAALVAFVLARSDAALSGTGLRRALRKTLPEYAVPARFQLVDALPLTATGKVDRKVLCSALPSRPATAGQPVAPRNRIESDLAAIWRSELGLEVLGVRDDYFALGGTSLQAVQIMTRIEERFARVLEPALLLEAPTIEQLARLLERDEFSGTQSLAVSLRAGGSGPALFCFPGNGGDPIVFAAFARHLEGDHPCYGLQTPGLASQQRPPRRLEDHARAQLAAIRALQPTGPYFLAGYSFGSTVAFEIARSLREAGERVGLLAMIDGWAPGHPRLRPDAPSFHRLLDRWLGAQLLERQRTSPRRLIGQSLKRLSRDLECRVRELLGQPLTAKQRRRRRKRAAIRTRARHRPGAYAGPLLLLRASRPSREKLFDDDPLRGWRPFAQGEVAVRDVPAHHMELLDEPHVRAIAAEISAAIARPQPAQPRGRC